MSRHTAQPADPIVVGVMLEALADADADLNARAYELGAVEAKLAETRSRRGQVTNALACFGVTAAPAPEP